MLQALVPLAVVHLSIVPRVDALAVSLASLKVTKVGVPIGVTLEALTASEIHVPIALILPPILVAHYSSAVSLAIYKLAHVERIWIPALNIVRQRFEHF